VQRARLDRSSGLGGVSRDRHPQERAASVVVDVVADRHRRAGAMNPALSTGPARSDVELVRSLVGGDLRALGLLFDRFEPDVKRLIGRMDVPVADRDDLVQLVFLDAARSAANYDDRWPVRNWLFGVALMIVRRHRRSVVQIAARVGRWAREKDTMGPARPDDVAENRELAQIADRALNRLTQKKREVFVMVVLEGMSGEDVADALGIPVATVWTRLHHARRELRTILKEHVS
jgi:RNA polymerase sigma-70 factor (ECF subfamily)